MSTAHNPLDNVFSTEEEVHPNRREHSKADPRPDDDDLERRTEIERSEVGLEVDGSVEGSYSTKG